MLSYNDAGQLIEVGEDVMRHHEDCDYRNSKLAGEDGYDCNLRCLERLPDLPVASMDNDLTHRYACATILLMLDDGDWWDPEHDECCRVLGLDPDNFRARDNDNWAPEDRGKVVARGNIKAFVWRALSK
jgi:hypothetical protein